MAAMYESGAGLIIARANGATAAGERDWHGLGLPMTAGADRDTHLREGGLDWSIIQRPVFVDGMEVPNVAACVRDSDARVLYIGDAKRNKIDFRQNADLYDEVDSVAKELGLSLTYLCSLKGGTSVVFTYSMGNTLAYVDPTGSPVDYFFSLIANRSNANRTIHGLKTKTRIVCSNTEASALREADSTGQQARIISSARINRGDVARMVERVHAGIAEQRAMDERMANDKLTDAEAARLFADVAGVNLADLERTTRNSKGEVVPVVSTKARNILAALNLSYRNAPGASPGNAFGALNAITHYTSHVRTVRDTQGDGDQGARVAANLIGDGAAMVAKATAALAARYAMAA